MSELEWYPADWVDESRPPSKASPQEFIVQYGDECLLGYRPSDKGVGQDDVELWNQPLKAGDVVQFVSCDRLPDVEATLRHDGSYELHGKIDPSHNVVIVDGDIDTLQGSFDALIKDIKSPEDPEFSVREMIFAEDETETRVTLQFANWSDPQSFLFEIVNGQPVFTPVPPQKN